MQHLEAHLDKLADFYASPIYGLADARYLRTRPAILASLVRSSRVTLPAPMQIEAR